MWMMVLKIGLNVLVGWGVGLLLLIVTYGCGSLVSLEMNKEKHLRNDGQIITDGLQLFLFVFLVLFVGWVIGIFTLMWLHYLWGRG